MLFIKLSRKTPSFSYGDISELDIHCITVYILCTIFFFDRSRWKHWEEVDGTIKNKSSIQIQTTTN